MPEVDDLFNKLDNDLGTGFRTANSSVTELYSFHCQICGYHNTHECKELACGCGTKLAGVLVYRKVNGVVIWDSRERKPRKR